MTKMSGVLLDSSACDASPKGKCMDSPGPGKYQPYLDYKSSALPGAVKVPAHWEVTRAKYLFNFITSGSRGWAEYYSEDGAIFFRIANLTRDSIEPKLTSIQYVTPPLGAEGERSRIQKGDLLISITADLGSICVADDSIEGGYVSQHVALCRPSVRVVDSRWLGYVVSSEGTKEQLIGAGYGGTKIQLSLEDIRAFLLSVPPLNERRAITSFLDHETARIDQLIAKQQRLIELLKEKRQAVISHAVTKGLNPDAPMEDSGVEWLGEVPEHWGIAPLRHLTDEVTVGIVVTPAKYYTESGIPCFRSLNIGENKIKDTNWVYISEESNQLLHKSQVHKGDIVVVRSGQTGTAAIVPEKHDGSNCIDLIIIRASTSYCSEFACFQLNSEHAKRQIAMGSDGAIQRHFNVEVAKSLIFTVPPIDEQSEIATYLNESNSKFDKLITKAKEQIDLLQERRTALISAAVTGKIDVRNWTHDAQAPEQDQLMAAEPTAEYRV